MSAFDAIAGLTFYLVGYNIMFAGVEETGLLGYGSTGQERAIAIGGIGGAVTMASMKILMLLNSSRP